MTSKHAKQRAISYCLRARAHLIPSTENPRQTVECAKSSGESISDDSYPIVRHLPYGQVVYIVEPTKDAAHFELVQRIDLINASMTEAAFHEAALRQLTEFANSRLELLEHGQSIWELSIGDGCEASLLLLDALWDEVLPQYVGSNFVAAIPHQDCLLVGASTAQATLTALYSSRRQVEQPVQYEGLLQRSNGSWHTANQPP